MQTDTTIANVVDVFAKRKDVATEEIIGHRNTREFCVIRYMIYEYLHNELRFSVSVIARFFGRTRANIFRGIRVLRGWFEYHEAMKDEYLSIINTIREVN